MVYMALAKRGQKLLPIFCFSFLGFVPSTAQTTTESELHAIDTETTNLPVSAESSTALQAFSADSVATLPKKRRNIVTKVVDYFRNANQIKDYRKFDFGFLPGPHYSSTAGFGLGMVATGTYTMDKKDPELPRSNVSLYGDISTKGFMLIGIQGMNIFPKERFRLDYRTYVYTFPTNFWGIGFENGDNDDNETEYRRIRVEALSRFLFRIAPKTYIGPMVNFKYIKALEIEEKGRHLFMDQDTKVHSQSAGISFTYDSRDFMLNAQRGWFIQLDQTFTPRFLGNDYCFSSTDLTVSTYRKVWKGGVLAGEFHSGFNYGNPAWCMLNEVGSTKRMRGYYEGRYRDKNIIEGQVELRQHIKGRNGAVLWLGAAEVFPEFEAMRFDKILPNVGLGYRWEFKKKINVRLDMGYGKNGMGFMFNINEAF